MTTAHEELMSGESVANPVACVQSILAEHFGRGLHLLAVESC